MAAAAPDAKAPKGLEGIVAAQSAVCSVDGVSGVLRYRGYDIHEMATLSTFEETAFLLLDGHLPTSRELDAFEASLAAQRELPPTALRVLREAAPRMGLMDALRTTVSALAAGRNDADGHGLETDRGKATAAIAQLATIVASWHRLRAGQEPIPSDAALGHAANFLWMLTGRKPSPAAARALDVTLLLHADHDLNAGTFAARVTAATLSDFHSALVSAIGTLKGPLHGGASADVMRALLDLRKSGLDPAAWVRRELAAKRRVPGFGDRVYRTLDPRAVHLSRLSRALGQDAGEPWWHAASVQLQEAMRQQKGMEANLDLFSATTYRGLGIPLELYTALFAMGRVAGWSAHILEQHGDNRLIRPLSRYVGPLGLMWVPADKRAPATG